MIGKRMLLLFLVAGFAGFFVDVGVLYALKPLLGLYAGRVVSFVCAVATTWAINRNFAFRENHSGRGLLSEFLVYLGLMLAGGAANYLVYALLVSIFGFFAQWPALAVLAGSAAGMGLNLVNARYVLFKLPRAPSGEAAD